MRVRENEHDENSTIDLNETKLNLMGLSEWATENLQPIESEFEAKRYLVVFVGDIFMLKVLQIVKDQQEN